MSKIFISYRREDAGGHARHLFQELVKLYGRKNVFMDVATLEGGEAWAERIDQEVAGCDAFIALIGKRWIDVRDAEGRRRLDEPGDYVRREVASGLARDVLAIPVLLDGASMPSEEELPDEIDELARRNAVELTSARWEYELEKLLELLPAPKRRWLVRTAVGVTIAVVLGAVFYLGSRTRELPAGDPERMAGIFNVAVLDFGERVGEGSPVEPSTEGRWIADRVFERLGEVQSSLAEDSDMSGVVELRRVNVPPRGATPGEVEASLSDLAGRLDATLVAHGILDLSEPPYRFAPSLYLTQEFNGGAELTGASAFGKPIRVALPLDETGPGRQNRLTLVEQLRGRLEALHLFTLGLAYMQIDDPGRALELFDRADTVEGWETGKEVLHLFRGSALALLGRPGEARDAYARSLVEGGEEYGRGLIGMGNLFFAQGRLSRAADLYRRAIAAEAGSSLAHIETKAWFNLGLTLASEARGLETACAAAEAHAALSDVVSSYESESESDVLRELAYKAWYQRGLLAQACGDAAAERTAEARVAYEESLALLGAAVELGEPRPIAGDPSRLEERRWQRDRWLVRRVLGYSQLRLAELGRSELYPEAIASLEAVTARYERALGDVPDGVAADAYRLLGRALEPSDPEAAARNRELAAALAGESAVG